MQEELLAADIASAIHQMAAAGRYGELLLLADTCQASQSLGGGCWLLHGLGMG